jgi:hypothetical protein
MPHSSSRKESHDSKSNESHVHPAPGSQEHENKASAQKPATSVHPVEPEDAKSMAQGGSRQNDALAQNIDGAGKDQGAATDQAKPHPETPAGQHATGSFTGNKRDRKTA